MSSDGTKAKTTDESAHNVHLNKALAVSDGLYRLGIHRRSVVDATGIVIRLNAHDAGTLAAFLERHAGP